MSAAARAGVLRGDSSFRRQGYASRATSGLEQITKRGKARALDIRSRRPSRIANLHPPDFGCLRPGALLGLPVLHGLDDLLARPSLHMLNGLGPHKARAWPARRRADGSVGKHRHNAFSGTKPDVVFAGDSRDLKSQLLSSLLSGGPSTVRDQMAIAAQRFQATQMMVAAGSIVGLVPIIER